MKAWSCLLLLVVPACAASRPTDDDAPGSGGTSGSGGAAGAGAYDPSTLQGFFGALCASEGPCCVDHGMSADPAECLAFVQAINVGITYDAVQGAECVKWLRAATNDYTVCLGSESPPAACDRAFVSPVGTHLPGEPCASQADCAPSTEGEVDCHVEISQRTCQLQLRGHAGDAPCLGTRDARGTSGVVFPDGAPARGYLCDLADGVFCDGTACKQLSPLGGPCDELQPCDLATYCDNATGACVARRAVAEPCDWDQCVASAYCDGATDRCATRLAAGALCTDSDQCASYICSEGACYDDGDGHGSSLLCVPK